MALVERQHTPYRMHEVVQRTGATPRQVRHWMALGLVWPEYPAKGPGKPVGFSPVDLAWIKVLSQLTDLGVDPGELREIAGRVGAKVYARRLERAARALFDADPWWLD